ncbi:unnamed protein product, partial [Prorocentrum cordatum]
EPMAKDFADVKTSIDNVRRDVEGHEGRLNNMEQEIKDLREGRPAASSSTAASSVGPPLRFTGLESAAQSVPSGPKRASDKICVTIGDWDRDTPRDTILNEARALTDTIPDKAEDGVFVPLKRASFLKVRFTSSGRMWAWERSLAGKQIIVRQPHHLGRRSGCSVEKPSEEIRLSIMITRAKKEMTDNLCVQAADLELDYIRGIVRWKQHRFGEMARTTGLMSFKEHVAADISAHTGVNLNLVESQAKVNAANYFAATPREQHDYDAAIFQGAGYWGKTSELEVGEGDICQVTPRVEGQKQMGQHEDSMDELSDLIMIPPPGAHPVVGVDAQMALPPPQADKERWIGDFPVGQRTRRAEILTRLLMQHNRAATNTFAAAASGPTCHCDFKHPPAQIDYVLIPARDIWKVSAELEEIADSAQSDHSAIKLDFTLGTRRRYVWNRGRAPMKGWTCLDKRIQRWSHSTCCADRNPAPFTFLTDAVHLAAAARGRGPPARKAPKLPEGHELIQTLRMLEDIIRICRKIWTANWALQRGLHEAGNPRVRAPRRAQPGPAHNQLANAEGGIEGDPLRIKGLLEREYGNAFRASDGEEPVGVFACPAHFATGGALDIPPFSPEMLREALCDMEAMKAPGVGGVVAEVLQALAWPKHVTQLMKKKKGDKHALKGYRPITLLTTFEKLYSLGLIKKCGHQLTLRSPQHAYRKFHQATDVIFSMRLLVEKAREQNRPIFIMGGDIEAAFDRVSHRSVEETLRRRAEPGPAILAIMRELKASAAIKTGSIQTQPVPRTRGI